MDLQLIAYGVLVSALVGAVKHYFGTNMLGTYITLAVAALVGSAIYVFLSPTSYWPVVMKVLMVSQTVYGLLLSNLPKPNFGQEVTTTQ